MRNYTLILLCILCFSGIENTLQASSTTSGNTWKTIDEQFINGVTTKLKIRQSPSLKTRDWISLEFENNTAQSLLIENAFYTIDCKIYDQQGGKILKEGKIACRSASELLDKSLDSPFPMIELSPGNNISSFYPSILGSLLLSAPEQSTTFVEAQLQLHLQLKGSEAPFTINWNDLSFAFEWIRPEPLEFSSLYQQLLDLLENPAFSTLHHYELLALLAVPEISKGVNCNTLIDALKKRGSRSDGRIAILYHLNDFFNEDKQVTNYYFDLLKNKNPLALEELTLAPEIWEDRFLEPLIEQYQNSNISQMNRIMNLLYLHQDSWIKADGIPAILSDLILYKFENIIYQMPEELDKHQLLTASLLLDMLGKTGNKEVLPIICPFLDEKERILDTGLVLDPNSMELPRPMRVCDHALEAILRLKEKDLIKVYKKEKFKPPYENGEAEIIISRIRDTLIKNLRKNSKNCK